MLDLYEELKALIRKLDGARVDYALCGALALAVYGILRATVGMDILIPAESLGEAKSLAGGLGYKVEADPMTFAGGAIEIRRLSKIDSEGGDLLTLDFLLVTPAIRHVWDTRHQLMWEGESLWVVSREGLIALKSLRRSGQDLDDIKRLREGVK